MKAQRSLGRMRRKPISPSVVTPQNTQSCPSEAFDGADDGRDIGFVGAAGRPTPMSPSGVSPQNIRNRSQPIPGDDDGRNIY